MVRCWLLNSIVPEIAECLVYVQSAKELWDELDERYGEANGPLIYQLHRDMTLLMQNNDPLTVYFNKVKKVWDELQVVDPIPQCTCGIISNCTCHLTKILADMESRLRLMQFLMGLNSGYEVVRSQILAMDPIPPVNKAYYLIQRVEKQRKVSDVINIRNEVDACAVQKQHINKNYNNVSYNKKEGKDSKKSKQDKFCDFCKVKGHTKDQCFC